MWCESREFLISSRMARSNKKRKLLRIGIIKIYDDWNNFSFRFRNARMTFARCSGNGVNGKSTRCHWKKKHGSFFWPFQFDLISSALVVKYLNDSARRIVWYDLDKREACLICRLEPLCCLCFRVFVCFAGIGTDMTQVGRLPLEVKRMLKCVEYGEQYFLKILFSNFHFNGSHLGFI